MTTFRYKPDKIKYLSNIDTLDTLHRKQVSDFEGRRNKIENITQEINKLENQLNILDENSEKNMSIIKEKSVLKSKIIELKQELYDIQNSVSELDYYSQTNDILLNYYNENISDHNPIQHNNNSYEEHNKEQNIDNNNIEHELENKQLNLNYLILISQKKRKIKKETKKRVRTNIYTPSRSILDFFDGEHNMDNLDSFDNMNSNKEIISNDDGKKNININIVENTLTNKASLFDDYINIVDRTRINKEKNNFIKICNMCNVEKTLIQAEGFYVCKNCGEIENAIIESELPNHKDSHTDKIRYPYKRLNHLCEWLNQFQAKETMEIPEEVYNNIMVELKKLKIINSNKITTQLIKQILKKLKYNQYYEHTPYIVSKITKKSPPVLNRNTEEKIKVMFKQIQEPFIKHCPSNRINFLSYSYVLHKIFQILELNEYVHYFDLLKSREKLRIQEEIWRKICIDLKWPFYPSISI